MTAFARSHTVTKGKYYQKPAEGADADGVGYLLSQSTAPLKSFTEIEEVEGKTKAANPKARSDPGGEDPQSWVPQLVARAEYKEQGAPAGSTS